MADFVFLNFTIVETLSALLGIAQRQIKAKRYPDTGRNLHRKPFPTLAATQGERIRLARIEKGLKLKQLAALLCISPHRLAAWESDRAVVSDLAISKLVKLLGSLLSFES